MLDPVAEAPNRPARAPARRHAAALLAALAVSCAPGAAGPALIRNDLDRSGTGFPIYRIPALAVSSAGTLIAAYDGRPAEGDLPADIALVVRRSTDGGRTWEPRRLVRHDPGPAGFGDPSLLVDRVTGRIFLFHAASVNQGFAGALAGNRDDDPDVLHADLSVSDDDGRTWRHRRLTAALKRPGWGGLFASSGQGIQLVRGPHAGRLVQQFVVRYQGGNWAASAVSDDHGDHWRMGELVGPGLDENKTVELADGTIMLNSRARPYRMVAYSKDGGMSYSAARPDSALADPGNNGSIIRAFPGSAADDPRSRWLLHSNTDDERDRRNLTIRLSCDDGNTWPVRRTVDPGPAAYSTLAALPEGDYGLLYERGGYQAISFVRFDLRWLGSCPTAP